MNTLYLNIKTEQQTETPKEDTISVADPRATNFFKPLPSSSEGIYKREPWDAIKGYEFSFTPNLTQTELNSITLQTKKDEKIKSIDTQTGLDIESIVGDNNKQKDLLTTYNYLLEQKMDGVITDEEIALMTVIKESWSEVKTLKKQGNDRELFVSLVEITTTLENAIAEIEAI